MVSWVAEPTMRRGIEPVMPRQRPKTPSCWMILRKASTAPRCSCWNWWKRIKTAVSHRLLAANHKQFAHLVTGLDARDADTRLLLRLDKVKGAAKQRRDSSGGGSYEIAVDRADSWSHHRGNFLFPNYTGDIP